MGSALLVLKAQSIIETDDSPIVSSVFLAFQMTVYIHMQGDL